MRPRPSKEKLDGIPTKRTVCRNILARTPCEYGVNDCYFSHPDDVLDTVLCTACQTCDDVCHYNHKLLYCFNPECDCRWNHALDDVDPEHDDVSHLTCPYIWDRSCESKAKPCPFSHLCPHFLDGRGCASHGETGMDDCPFDHPLGPDTPYAELVCPVVMTGIPCVFAACPYRCDDDTKKSVVCRYDQRCRDAPDNCAFRHTNYCTGCNVKIYRAKHNMCVACDPVRNQQSLKRLRTLLRKRVVDDVCVAVSNFKGAPKGAQADVCVEIAEAAVFRKSDALLLEAVRRAGVRNIADYEGAFSSCDASALKEDEVELVKSIEKNLDPNTPNESESELDNESDNDGDKETEKDTGTDMDDDGDDDNDDDDVEVPPKSPETIERGFSKVLSKSQKRRLRKMARKDERRMKAFVKEHDQNVAAAADHKNR